MPSGRKSVGLQHAFHRCGEAVVLQERRHLLVLRDLLGLHHRSELLSEQGLHGSRLIRRNVALEEEGVFRLGNGPQQGVLGASGPVVVAGHHVILPLRGEFRDLLLQRLDMLLLVLVFLLQVFDHLAGNAANDLLGPGEAVAPEVLLHLFPVLFQRQDRNERRFISRGNDVRRDAGRFGKPLRGRRIDVRGGELARKGAEEQRRLLRSLAGHGHVQLLPGNQPLDLILIFLNHALQIRNLLLVFQNRRGVLIQ